MPYQAVATDDQVTALFFVSSQEVKKIVAEVVSQLQIIPEFIMAQEQDVDHFCEYASLDKKWYKIFYFLDGETHDGRVLRKILQFWKTRPELTYVVMHSPFSLNAHSSHYVLGKKLYDIYQVVNQISPYTSVFFYNSVVFSPTYSLLEQEISRAITGKQVFSLENFSPISFYDIVSASIQLSYGNRGGQRKTIIGDAVVHLEEVLSLSRTKDVGIELANPEEMIVIEQIGELVTQKSQKGGQWSALFDEETHEQERKHAIHQSLDIPKPTLFTSSKKPRQSRETPRSQPLKNQQSNPKVEKKIEQARLQVTSTAPILPQSRSILIPSVEIPAIKRSHLILQSLEEHRVVTKPTQSEKVFPTLLHRPTTPVVNSRKMDKSIQKDEEIELRMNNLFHSIIPTQHSSSTTKNDPPTESLSRGDKYKQKKKSAQSLRVFLGVVVMVFLTIMASGASYLYSKSAVGHKVEKSLTFLEREGTLQKPLSSNIARWSTFLRYQLMVFGAFDPQQSMVRKTVEMGERIGKIEALQQRYNTLQSAIQRQVFFGKPGQVIKSLEELSPVAQQYYVELAELESEVVRLSDSEFTLQKSEAELLQGTLAELRRKAFITYQITQIAPSILGKDGQKQYALVIQDETELRPSGGVLLGVVLVTVDQGQITNTQSFSETEVDNMIAGEVEAPADFSLVFDSKSWEFRDSGWNPDLTQSAPLMLKFIEKTSQKPIDGIFTITTQSLVSVLGDSSITRGGELYTGKNLIDKYFVLLQNNTDGQAEDHFFSLATIILKNFLQPDSLQLERFWGNLSKLLLHGDVQVYIPDQRVHTTISALGWSGEVLSPACPTQLSQDTCRVFAVYQVDANVNKNKSNATVLKKVQESIIFKTDQTIHKRIASYESGSNHNSFPNGNYRNYSRLYLPKNTILQLVEINGEKLKESQISDIETPTQHVVGFYVEIPPGGKVEVVTQYVEEPLSLPSSYAYFNQKQPGEKRVPTIVTFEYGTPIFPSVVAPEAQVNTDRVEFHFYGDQHVFAGAKFRNINQK